jgi:hypothetical protein
MRQLAVILSILGLLVAACGDDDAAAPEALATEAPATEAPATEAPATEAPATEAPATEPVWESVPGSAECLCSDASPWNFWVRVADPTKVVLFFQGGGACFSAETCDPASGSYKANVGPGDDPTNAGGVFDFANPANPFTDWSFVFVPYCTGDVHIGDNTQSYGEDLTVEHNGFVNGSFALEHLVERFPDAAEIFVTGSSAGGVPAPLFAGLAADRFPEARIVALADGSGAYPDVPGVNAAIGALWGSFSVAPDWEVNEGLTVADWSIPGLFVQAGLHAPDVVMARHDHAFDAVQASFTALAGLAGSEVDQLIDGNAEQIEAEGVEVFTFVAPGDAHTILGQEFLYTQEVDGVRFIDWLTNLATGQPVADVHCVQCAA